MIIISITSSINLKVSHYKSEQISSLDVIQKLLLFGWTLNDSGLVSFLPLGDDGDFDWKRKDISLESLLIIIKGKQEQNEVVGVVLTWKDIEIGGQFLFWNDGNMSVILNVNRRLINEMSNMKITDVNWYLCKIIPIFDGADLRLESFTYEELV